MRCVTALNMPDSKPKTKNCAFFPNLLNTLAGPGGGTCLRPTHTLYPQPACKTRDCVSSRQVKFKAVIRWQAWHSIFEPEGIVQKIDEALAC